MKSWLLVIGLLLNAHCKVSAADISPIPEVNLNDWCEGPAKCSIAELKGNWGFQKSVLLEPLDILSSPPASTLKVPGTWSPVPLNPWSPVWAEAKDVGTYWLLLRNVSPMAGLSLALNGVHSSYRLYWQALNEPRPSSPVFELGWNEQNPLASEASLREDIIALPLKGDQADYLLVIQVANSQVAKGGLRMSPRLGLGKDFQAQARSHFLLYGFIVGAMGIVAVYHLLIFFQRRADRSALWLAVECLSIAAHTVAMQGIMYSLFPEPSNSLVLLRTWMMYIPHILAPISFYAFLVASFPRAHHRYASWFFYLPTGLLSILLFTPLSFMSRLYIVIFLPVMVAFLCFIFWRSLVVLKGDREFRLIMATISVLALASLHDAFYEANRKSSDSLLPFAELLLIMVQGGLLSKRFARAYETASKLSRDLEKEVARQTREIRSILATIQQGIITIQGPQLAFGAERSKYMDDFFSSAMNSNRFEDFLNCAENITSDQRDQVNQSLHLCVGESLLSFELNSGQFPQELSFRIQHQEKLFEVDWRPMLDEQGVIEKMLVCLRDVSEIRQLRDQSRQHEEELRIIDELLNIPEDRFKTFVNKVSQYLKESRVLIGSLESERAVDRNEVIRQIFMNIHTIKGTSRTLHFKALAAASHDLETEISLLKSATETGNLPDLNHKLDQLRLVLDHYQRVSHQKLGWDLQEENVKLPRRIVLDCAKLLSTLQNASLDKDQRKDVQALEISLQTYCPTDLAHALRETTRGLDSIARDLNKAPPHIEVVAAGFMLTDLGSQLIQGLFTHILRNAMDHGLEEEADRLSKAKPIQGTIHIEAHLLDRDLVITCQDDGRGLDLKKIRARAEQQGLIDAKASYTREAIADLIFRTGLSTKDAVTEISGRGVGMDAVRNFMESVGGKAEVQILSASMDDAYIPFKIVLSLPQEFWWLSRTTDRVLLSNQSA